MPATTRSRSSLVVVASMAAAARLASATVAARRASTFLVRSAIMSIMAVSVTSVA